MAVLEGYREPCSVACYVLNLLAVRMVLRFLNRIDLAEKGELPCSASI